MTARLSVIAAFLALAAAAGAQAPPRTFVVVFDDEHLSSGGLKRLQAAAVSLFTDQFHPGDLGGVVVDGQLVNNRLLSDRAELLSAVARAHPRLATASDLEASTQVTGGVEQSRRLAEIETLDVARAALDRKLSIVETLVANLARVDGAKAVLLASDGFGGDGAAPRVAAIGETARRAGVRFYVFDESGNDHDAAGGLARWTGGQVAHRASEFLPAIGVIVRDTTLSATAAVAAAASSALPAGGVGAVVPAGAPAAGVRGSAPAALAITPGVVVASPSAEPGVLRVRPLVESHVTDLAGGDWSDAAARAGWDAYQRGDLESARAALAPITARSVAPSWIEYVVGQASYGLGQFGEAAVAWERVRKRQPQFEPVYLDLADDYTKLKEHKKAIEVLRAARQRWPKDVEVVNALGVIQAGGGQLDEAVKTLREATALAPKETITYLNLAMALEMQYFEKRRNARLLGWPMRAADARLYQDALNAYAKYLSTDGPYGEQAREGVERLTAAGPARRRR